MLNQVVEKERATKHVGGDCSDRAELLIARENRPFTNLATTLIPLRFDINEVIDQIENSFFHPDLFPHVGRVHTLRVVGVATSHVIRVLTNWLALVKR